MLRLFTAAFRMVGRGFRQPYGSFVNLSAEEARTVIEALRRSAEVYEMHETLFAHRARIAREERLADAMRARLGISEA